MIIDFHVHAFNPKIAEKAVGKLAEVSKIKPYTYGLIDDTIKCFDQWGAVYYTHLLAHENPQHLESPL
ncbi:MAG: hypothetical protein K2F81_09100, partial [Ruminococcus sp.]|nr:hypothetical protein [Ruminococcus sp.]